MIELDLYPGDGRPRRDQAGEGGLSERRLLAEDESSAVSVSISPGPRLGRDSVAIRPSGLPVLNINASAAAGKGITTAANVSAAIPVRAFKGMSALSVMIFLPSPVWKIVAVLARSPTEQQQQFDFVRHDPSLPLVNRADGASAYEAIRQS